MTSDELWALLLDKLEEEGRPAVAWVDDRLRRHVIRTQDIESVALPLGGPYSLAHDLRIESVAFRLEPLRIAGPCERGRLYLHGNPPRGWSAAMLEEAAIRQRGGS